MPCSFVPLTARKDALFEQIVRLRRAEREHPSSRDIVAVRAQLERELGLVVTRSRAARLLGVRHSSLQRWIDSQDVPVVMDPQGRVGVPVEALLNLYERVEPRSEGHSQRHVLESVLGRGYRAADELDPRTLIGWYQEHGTLDPHRRATLRSLAYHRAVARRLDQPMIDAARHRIWVWRDAGAVHDRYADAWEAILRRPIPEVRKALSDESGDAADLRQGSPFAGVLSEPERRKVLAEIR